MCDVLFLCHETVICYSVYFFFQAEDGIRDLVRSRGLGDVYKRQNFAWAILTKPMQCSMCGTAKAASIGWFLTGWPWCCLLYTSDAADERSSVDLGGRRIIKKKKNQRIWRRESDMNNTCD